MKGSHTTKRLQNAASGLVWAAASLCISYPASAGEKAAAKPVPSLTQTALAQKVIPASAPIYIRVFKEESELEVWKQRRDGRYVALKTFPICKWSGALGPKQSVGDHMAPEGFYGFSADGLKPDSKYHLALNVGYPNALDRALGRTGDFIMVHGQCVSVGCFAMTNDLIEEIYALARDAIDGGAARVPVHIFPFRMSAENLKRHAGHPAKATWAPLKEAYDDFARTQMPPVVGVCGSRYVVNPIASLNGSAKDACPARIGKLIAPLSPKKARKLAFLSTPLIADGPKTRTVEDISTWQRPGTGAMMLGSVGGDERGKAPKEAVASPPIGGSMTPYLDAVK
ncbi:MAG: murein L,D-transpeptidase family protein [Hyphomicrobium sp.]|nr:murein L,D-transpeptidase [Hyphomicrobium sp.]